MRTWLTWLIALGFGIVVVATDWLHEMTAPPQDGKMDDAQRPDSIIEDYLVTLHAEDGQPRYRLAGPRLSHYPHDDSNRLERPHLTVYEQVNDPAWTVEAERGFLSSGAEELLLAGPVTLERLPGTNRPPLRIDTRDLTIHPRQDLAETEAPVKITGPDYVVDAVGARAKLYDEGPLVELHSRVRGRHEPINRP
ncbi:MAG: LPS export ABC transporter periplasmic protein LptC [Gammaproteobacteria bacterium]|nr:LPS export ABC transporter periplasmic protein LptC [Gammaproteobacteria bacterium]